MTTVDFKKIRELYDIWDNSFGVSDNEIALCETRLSIKLPRLLKEYYLQFGNHKKLNQTQDKPIAPQNLYFKQGEKLIFYIENQGNVIWGIDRHDLYLENPPVFISFEEGSWTLEDNLDKFLTSMAYLQSIFAFPFNANAIDISYETEKTVRSTWKKSDTSIKIWNAEFFQNSYNEVLAFLKSDTQIDLFVAAKTQIGLKNINAELNLDWDYNSIDD
ncbi:hypothetical protein [Runella zeae]|uniref:hypothetical protein n=1 Tax=Runella zeae TaxID=94255 RepID=UPI002355589A|nr:hypothetical protein [Runella zeae]